MTSPEKRNHEIVVRFLSQEDLLQSGCLDLPMAIASAEHAMVNFRDDMVLFPEKIVQIFDEKTQDRINCLPATFLLPDQRVCGVKWVSVFPHNPDRIGRQNLTAVILLSEIESGFPIAYMEGTLCSNMRVGAMGAIAAKHLARKDAKVIGFIGAGEQAKMHLIAMKSVRPGLEECRVAAKAPGEEGDFVTEMQPIFPGMKFVTAGTDLQAAIEGADIIVTATSAQAPLLKANWIAPGAFYSHVGGWEDEYAVAKACEKIVCDDWETVKHRTQTLSRMFQDGELTDADIHANLVDLVTDSKPGRENDQERIYFNAVGLAYADIAIAHSMFERAQAAGAGRELSLQETMIFKHPDLAKHVRV